MRHRLHNSGFLTELYTYLYNSASPRPRAGRHSAALASPERHPDAPLREAASDGSRPHFEPLELRVLEDGTIGLEPLRHRVAERARKLCNHLVHVLRLGNQARFVARLPVVALITHRDIDSNLDGVVEQRDQRRVTLDQMLPTHD